MASASARQSIKTLESRSAAASSSSVSNAHPYGTKVRLSKYASQRYASGKGTSLLWPMSSEYRGGMSATLAHAKDASCASTPEKYICRSCRPARHVVLYTMSDREDAFRRR